MGIGVSSWRLANAVARCGQLGIVSGTAIDSLFVRRLQDGDIGGHMRRALAAFPIPGVAEELLKRFFLQHGRAPGAAYRLLPMYRQTVSSARQRVTVAAAFVEAWLAREGHDGPIGINLLTKVQMPNIPTLYGAMLAGVSCVVMGAGIPREIPGVLDTLAQHQTSRMKFDVEGMPKGETAWLTFDPATVWPDGVIPDEALLRPAFLPVVSASSLAATLVRKSNGKVNGIVVEGPTAGGHNAPPRGVMHLDDSGQPVYGERDQADFAAIAELGLPFWIAGGRGSPEGLREAQEQGARGIQVGTLFAFSSESGLSDEVKQDALAAVRNGTAEVFTDPRASPTGYPFKVLDLDGRGKRETKRERVCDLGYLRVPRMGPEGKIIYLCSAEPVDTYVAKGGDIADTEGRECLCNGLMSDAGHATPRDGYDEPPFITSGDDLEGVKLLSSAYGAYSAADALHWLLTGKSEGRLATASNMEEETV